MSIRTHIQVAVCLAALFCQRVPAQETTAPAPDVEKPRFPMLEQMRERNPDEYERLKALRTSDPAAFKREMQTRVGSRQFRGRPGRGGGPGGREGGQGPGGGAFQGEGGRRPGGGKGGMFGRRMGAADGSLFFEQLKEENPEKFEEITRLREENPDEFRRKLRELAGSSGRGHGMGAGPAGRLEEQKCQELTRLYHEAKDQDEKGRIRAELREAVQAVFDQRLETHRARLQDMESRFRKMREMLEARESNRDAVCEERLKELTKDPALSWDTRW